MENIESNKTYIFLDNKDYVFTASGRKVSNLRIVPFIDRVLLFGLVYGCGIEYWDMNGKYFCDNKAEKSVFDLVIIK